MPRSLPAAGLLLAAWEAASRYALARYRRSLADGPTRNAALLRELLPVPRDPAAPLQPRLDLPQGLGSPRPLSPAAGAPASSPIAQPAKGSLSAP